MVGCEMGVGGGGKKESREDLRKENRESSINGYALVGSVDDAK